MGNDKYRPSRRPLHQDNRCWNLAPGLLLFHNRGECLYSWKPGQVLETKTQDRERLTGWLSGYNDCSTNKMSRFPAPATVTVQTAKMSLRETMKTLSARVTVNNKSRESNGNKNICEPTIREWWCGSYLVLDTISHHCFGSYRQVRQMETSCRSRTDMSHFRLMFHMSANQQSHFKQPHRSFRAISEVSSEGNRVP